MVGTYHNRIWESDRVSDKRFNPKHLHKLDSPEREKLLPKEEILAALNIQSTDTILDLGSGTGYFTIPLANKTNGTVYGLDVEKEMLLYLKDRFTSEDITNVELVEGKIENVPLQDQMVDKVVASMVLHEIEPLKAGLNEINRLLRKGGRCLVVEWVKKDATDGPPKNHRLDADILMKNIKENGFQNVEITYSSEEIYVVCFNK